MKRVMLIQPTFKFKYLDVPLGLLYIGTYLKEHGVEVSLYTGRLKDLKKEFKKRQPDIIGLYATTLHIQTVRRYIRHIRNLRPTAEILIGGPHPSISPDFFLDTADGIIIGEAEESFLEYVRQSDKKKPDFSKVEGLSYKKDGIIKRNKKTAFSDLSKIPLPDFSMIDMRSHIRQWPYFDYKWGVRGISLVTSRGCPFDCSYCQPITRNMFGRKIRQHSVSQVVKKMQEAKQRYDINSFFFHDDTFTWNKTWVKEFCDTLKKKNMDIDWICNTRIDMVDADLLKKMAAAGCQEIRFGIESVNQKALVFYNKRITLDKIRSSIRLAKKAGLKTFGFFMIGAPMETEKDIRKTIDFAIHSKLDFARFSILVNMPGTHMSEKLGEQYLSPDGFDYIKDSRNNLSPLPFRKLERIRKQAHLRFYFHPKRLPRTVKSLLSPRGLLAKLERF
jgi:anaerobic magnesium-protoporphyrin IX monomethyl ester cyclase